MYSYIYLYPYVCTIIDSDGDRYLLYTLQSLIPRLLILLNLIQRLECLKGCIILFARAKLTRLHVHAFETSCLERVIVIIASGIVWVADSDVTRLGE